MHLCTDLRNLPGGQDSYWTAAICPDRTSGGGSLMQYEWTSALYYMCEFVEADGL